MKILVISDTHHYINNVLNLIYDTDGITDIIHLGDTVSDAQDIQAVFPQIDMHLIRGNNDFCFGVTDEILLNLCGYRIFATHGHMYSVKRGLDKLAYKGKTVGADIVLFGHTHIMYDGIVCGVRLINPSSNGYVLIEKDSIEVKRY